MECFSPFSSVGQHFLAVCSDSSLFLYFLFLFRWVEYRKLPSVEPDQMRHLLLANLQSFTRSFSQHLHNWGQCGLNQGPSACQGCALLLIYGLTWKLFENACFTKLLAWVGWWHLSCLHPQDKTRRMHCSHCMTIETCLLIWSNWYFDT